MSVLKCKMCGGDLEIVEGESVAVCEYCGSKQTVPNVDDEKKANLFARANRLRISNEFDKAFSIYENIVADFPEEAEAYWGLVLCKYGIEYVDDPATAKKVPTCHRSSFDSVMEDSDFEQVMENSDSVARKVYREQAKEIEEIRKGIIEVSGKEQPYDIFICYKETDEDGERTIDSVIAQDVYDELTQKGYRVFFSRITLEDKLGQEYEPYIFAALNSAKVMLAFGTDYDYYNAVWVKNEWSRFLKLMEKDKSKHLIPCYKNIDAYDIPKEFAKLQAQDMGKVGAVQDLIRGIDKLTGKKRYDDASQNQSVVQQVGRSNITALIDRGYMALEDKEWEEADEFFEEVLNQDSRCAKAYLGKLLVERKLSKIEQLEGCILDIDKEDKNYKRVIQYTDTEINQKLGNIIAIASEKKRIEEQNKKEKLLIQEEHKKVAMKKLNSIRESIAPVQMIISSGNYHTIGLNLEGKVISVGRNIKGECNVNDWTDIIAVSAGNSHTVGLKSDGTVVATGSNEDGRCNVKNWSDIVAISAGNYHTIGLKSDGTVVATGYNKDGRCNIKDWNGIVAISTRGAHTVGLKSNGTVVAVGCNEDGQCNVDDWNDIFAIGAGNYHTVGLKIDGTVIATGYNEDGRCNVEDWIDIVAISTGYLYTLGLKSDGTVVAAGNNEDDRSNVKKWNNMVTISAGEHYIAGLKLDGSVVATGDNSFGQCNVKNWKLFNKLENFEVDRKNAMKKAMKQNENQENEIEGGNNWAESCRSQGICQHCGGTFKGLFTKKCSQCGREKDY